MDWEGHGSSYQEAAREDLIQATKVGESQVKVIQESVRDRSVEKSDLSNRVNNLQECLSPNLSSDDLLSSENNSKDSLLEWFYVKRGVKPGTTEIVYTSLQDLEGDVNNENYQGLEEDANEEDCQDLEVETENVSEEDLLNKKAEREDTRVEYSQAKVMKGGDVKTKYSQDIIVTGKDERDEYCELKHTKERKYWEEVDGKIHDISNFLKTEVLKSEDSDIIHKPPYITDHHNILAFPCFPSKVSLPRLSVVTRPKRSIECFKVKNLSCNSMNGINFKAVLQKKSVSSDSGVPKKLVLNKPKEKSSQLLSKETLEIYSASTEPVHKKPIFNKKVCAKKLLCTECGKCFCLKNHLEKHMKVHEKPTMNMKVNEKNVFCTVCGKYFLRKNHLESHMRTIHKSKLLACKIGDCGMAFCDKRQFNSHKLKAHNILV